MLFYTPEFLVFSMLLLATLALVKRDEPRKVVLLVASYGFYMWWNPLFIVLIAFATAVNYMLGKAIDESDDDRRRGVLLATSLVSSLGLLAYFKYTGFLADTTLVLMRELGFAVHWSSIEITLPVGISFYTVQALSYTIDVYRRDLRATASPLDFALYIAFFPQLVAGPIVRAAEFLPQLRERIRISCDQTTFFLIARGLAKKVLVADNLAILPDAVFGTPEAFPSIVIWLASACFAVQIYCDFSGYSDIAIGIARVLGFRIPVNFDHPYAARNPSDFWRRWHISLSSWLRDYLYVSLGGNRGGSFNTYRNLMLTMLLGGLWHGASWNFVLWGFLHGFYLVVHRLYGNFRLARDPGYQPASSRFATLASIVAMQYCVFAAWIAFRVTDFDKMLIALQKYVFFDFDFGLANIGLGGMAFFSTLFLLTAFACLHWYSRSVGHIEHRLGELGFKWAGLICFVLGFISVMLWPLTDQPFIYFQF